MSITVNTKLSTEYDISSKIFQLYGKNNTVSIYYHGVYDVYIGSYSKKEVEELVEILTTYLKESE